LPGDAAISALSRSYFVLRKTSDEIGAANGWKFHVDGVHLNRRGGMILAGLVQDSLDS
jgi:hypothetical protein